MSKAALIERLAVIVRAGHFAGEPSCAWSDIPESTREEYREDAREMWPLIVAFVETWIERDGGFDDEAVERAERWNGEMGQ